MMEKVLPLEPLRAIPLFRGFPDDDLARLAALFRPVDAAEGDVLFDAGEEARAFYLLVAGQVTLLQEDREAYLLHAPVLIGELGGLTGVSRQSRAKVGPGAELWRIDGTELRPFFDANPSIGLRFLHDLLTIAADKIERDQLRIEEMRRNIIRTQKQMKRMRDFLLESPDTVVSQPLFDSLEQLIRQNRRVNYRVEPPAALSACMRLDDGTETPVVQISRTHVSFAAPTGAPLPAKDQGFSGVLCLAGPEIPVSGRVIRVLDRRVDLELDLLIDEYVAVLEGYLTRVQMLDFLV